MKKYVLTGGPGSGKSSILIALELKGYQVIREAAEDYIRHQQALGIREPWLDEEFQKQIFWLQHTREKNAKGELVFVDRGLFDNYAYEPEGTPFYREMANNLLAKGRKTELIKELGDYAKIFLIEHPGIVERNDVRRENILQARFLEKELEKIYTSCGYEVIRIPFAQLEQRVEEIIKNL
ncbi:AAA family ATPase [Candidatus Woesearchaeota archaeon]|nr:AAA family ATPase [Candidatus Woesearchaeota archaeon]